MGHPGADKREFSNRDRWLAVSFVSGPLAPLMSLLLSYTLSPTACAQGSNSLLHIATLGFLVISLLSAGISWRVLQLDLSAEDALSAERTRWLAMLCLILALGGAVVIAAFEIPNLILRSCQ